MGATGPDCPYHFTVMDNPIGRKSLPHEVPPHISPNPEGDVFFITIGCKQRGTNQLTKDEIWKAILETLLLRESKGEIQIRLVLAMPDHLHGLFIFHGVKPMKQVIRDFKSWMAKTQGIKWERDFFDHRLRSWESARQKGEYIRENPVRAGLLEIREEWEYVYDTIKR